MMSAGLQEDPAPEALGASSFRTTSYVSVVVCFVVGAFLFWIRSDGIFSCPAKGYGSDGYLAYCQASGYGEYDRGAFWYGLERHVQQRAASADVLFLGSSRMQFALSTRATSEWFSSTGTRFYLLGFTHTENLVFARPLLAQLRPHPRAYVINVDRFFDDQVTEPTRAINQDGDSRMRYRQKWLWQMIHQPMCTAMPLLCGNQLAFFRERQTGTWRLGGAAALEASDVSDGPPSDQERWPHYVELGRAFLESIPVERDCVVLTIAPYAGTKRAEAVAIAAAFGMEIVSPQLDGLRTFDGSHLDPPSAERWSRAFFGAAGPRLRSCLGRS